MIIKFKNNCESKICVCIGSLWEGIIDPNKNLQIFCEPISALTLSISVLNYNRNRGSIYNLNLVSQYTFNNLDSDIEFLITHEKLRVSLYISYERLFVEAAGATKTTEKTVVKDAEKIIKRYKRDRLGEILYGPLTHFPVLSIGLFVGGILLAMLMDWWLIFLYYPLIYIGLLGLYWLIDILCKFISKRALKIDKTTEFYQFFDPLYISNYYSQTIREPFMEKVDRK